MVIQGIWNHNIGNYLGPCIIDTVGPYVGSFSDLEPLGKAQSFNRSCAVPRCRNTEELLAVIWVAALSLRAKDLLVVRAE